MLGTLLRLQILAFRRAPHFGGRLVLAILKALGLTYAIVVAALLGFLIPDTLSVWAPEVSALELVERGLLPAIGMLTIGRVLFQDIPTRGAEAFLLLPVQRQRVARAVLVRSLASVLNIVPMVFVIPFAARTIRAASGASAAWMVVVGVGALVALSHVGLVVWKTRLGERPIQTVALLGGLLAAVAGLDLATGGLIAQFRAPGGWVWVGLGWLLATGLSVHAYRGVVEALYLDRAARPAMPWARRRTAGANGFRQSGIRAFVEMDLRQLARTRYPRGIVLNAALLGVSLSVLGLVSPAGEPSTLLMVFAVATVAISAGQFTLPFTSSHYDRFLTLPSSLPTFLRAKLVLLISSVWGLGAIQLGLAMALDSADWSSHVLSVGTAVLFGSGVLVPIAIFGSSLGPKPIDVRDRVMLNTKVQSFPAQIVIGGTSIAAALLFLALGPRLGLMALAGIGAVGVAALPLWEQALLRRLRRQRHAVAARFRTSL
ncbi:MAG: DUF5687 family protein [Bacteroidota bacterium]